jgi:hypothetical protein
MIRETHGQRKEKKKMMTIRDKINTFHLNSRLFYLERINLVHFTKIPIK